MHSSLMKQKVTNYYLKLKKKLNSLIAFSKKTLKLSSLRFKGAKKVLLLHWYQWVKVDLEEQLSNEYLILKPSRKEVMAQVVKVESPVKVNQSNYQHLTYDNIDLWEVCKSSICDHLIKTSLTDSSDFEVIESYYNKAIHLIQAFTKFYQQYRPHSVVVEQGFQYDMRIAVEIARKFNCKTIAIENSFLKDYFFMDSSSGGICNRHFLARNAWDIIKAHSLDVSQKEKVRNFMASYSTTISQGSNAALEELRQKATKGSQKKIALLFGQVATDAAIVMDSYIYPDILDFMEDAAQIMKEYQEEYQLVIRLHPKEAYGNNHHGVPFDNMTLKRLQERGIDQLDHVTIFHSKEVNTYQLMELAELGLVINSQTGLEFLSQYKPLVVLGDAFYANKGFTHDVSCQEAFPLIVKKVIENPALSDHQKSAIDQFLYYMIFEYLYPKDLLDCKQRLASLFS